MSIVLIIILVALVLIVYFYNGLVTANNKVKNAWVDLENLLKQRYGLVSKIIESKKNTPEAETLIKLQSKAMQATSLQDKSETEQLMSQELEKIDGEFSQELKALEDQIQTSRRFYNGTVRDLNLKLITMPNNLIAEKLGFLKAELFATQEEIKNELIKIPEVAAQASEPTNNTDQNIGSIQTRENAPVAEPSQPSTPTISEPEPASRQESTTTQTFNVAEPTPPEPSTPTISEPEPVQTEQTQTPGPTQAQPGQPPSPQQ